MSSVVDRITEVLAAHPLHWNEHDCVCGWVAPERSWAAEHAAHQAALVLAALELTEEVSNDIAGPEWATYSRWVTPSVVHHGPAYLAGLPSQSGDTHE